MELLSPELTQTGFAVAVAGFLLLRLEGRIKALTEAIEQLKACQICRYKGAGSAVQDKTLQS